MLNIFTITVDAAENESGIGEFTLNIPDIIFTVLAFAVLLFLMKKFVLGKVTKVIDDRENKILEEMNNAEIALKNAADLENKQKDAFENATEEVTKFKKNAILDAEKKALLIIEQAEAEKAINQAAFEKDMAAQKIQMQKDLEAEAVAAAVTISKNILKKEIAAPDQKDALNNFLKD